MENYAAIMTTRGLAMIMESIRDGTPINLKYLAVGDSDHEPEKNQTALVNERCRFELLRSAYDDDNPLWLRLSAVIPPDIGGWRIHEVGIFTEGNELFAVARAGGDYKPVYKNGMVKEVELELIVEISEQANFVLAVDPHKVIATRQWVEEHFERALGAARREIAAQAAYLIEKPYYEIAGLSMRLTENELRGAAFQLRGGCRAAGNDAAPELYRAAIALCGMARRGIQRNANSIRGGH